MRDEGKNCSTLKGAKNCTQGGGGVGGEREGGGGEGSGCGKHNLHISLRGVENV